MQRKNTFEVDKSFENELEVMGIIHNFADSTDSYTCHPMALCHPDHKSLLIPYTYDR